jgi:hypothetical protein
MYEFVKKGDPPVIGITKLSDGVTAEDLLRPRKKLPTPDGSVPASEAVVGPSASTSA